MPVGKTTLGTIPSRSAGTSGVSSGSGVRLGHPCILAPATGFGVAFIEFRWLKHVAQAFHPRRAPLSIEHHSSQDNARIVALSHHAREEIELSIPATSR